MPVQPSGQLVVVVDGVLADRAEVEPRRHLGRTQGGPVVVVLLVSHQDGPVVAVPQGVVVVAGPTGVHPHEPGVHTGAVQGLGHVDAVTVPAHIGDQTGAQAQPGEADRGVAGISHGLQDEGLVEGDLGAERHGEPGSPGVMGDPGRALVEPDDGVRGDVADAQHFEFCHRSGQGRTTGSGMDGDGGDGVHDHTVGDQAGPGRGEGPRTSSRRSGGRGPTPAMRSRGRPSLVTFDPVRWG